MTRNYVVVKFTDGRIKIWRDYGEIWGSPIYEVLSYFNSYKDAMIFAMAARNE